MERRDPASMGPGSFDPGNTDVRRPAGAGTAASMGPGSFDPGNEGAVSVLGAPLKLQWGRGLLTPEIRNKQ